jgi:hypothetical protein
VGLLLLASPTVNRTPQAEAWELLAELEHRHRAVMARHDEAFRHLPAAHDALRSAASMEAWRRYCEAVRELDETTAQLERIIWQVSQGSGT